ncbi:MAG: hypothetical protein DI556_03665 [Rhodovulum sulfidophilum]|uniref:Anaphase-promoting complex subunit 4 WD40 domain-containing protein n=1 Tax=Rhodovulum sulfidophilum TaxID=35806 RepID=A0A2W5NCL7_RHOSU|nr:MAG: hypothetical protein DI556_03665 [Rhodovulum sulfidophilum]
MNQPNPSALTLFDLLARRWQARAAVADIRFAADGATTAFATADGAVLIAPPDAEPPDRRIRVSGDLGQTTIRPREAEPTALVTISSLAEGAPPLAVDGARFLVGDGDGRVLGLGADGATEPLLTLGGAVVALDHAAGVTAAADAASLLRAGPDGAERRALPGLRALALAPDGRQLAIADAAQVEILGPRTRRFPLPGATRLVWRGDGAWLAAALGTGGVGLVSPEAPGVVRLAAFPAPVRGLAWSADGLAFVAAGAFRVAAWAADPEPAPDTPLVTGHPGLVLVEAVAAHPTRPLVAAGYANGQVTIAALGGRDELLLRQGGAAVTRIAFSPDGSQLAIGDADGAIAIAGLPARMFK